jgi:hypothetical protein
MGGSKSREAHGPGVLVVPNSDCCNGMTQADCNVCRWLADHGPGDRVRRGRAGEGEQVVRCAGAVRYARCGEPKHHCPSSELCSDVTTGERPEIERLMGSFGEGWLEKLCQLGGRSLATYSTCTLGSEGG